MHNDGFGLWGFGHGVVGLIVWTILIVVILYMLKDIFGKK
jgi:hypothetical protein